MTDDKLAEHGVTINGIEILESHLYNPNRHLVNDQEFTFNIKVNQRVDPSGKLLGVICEISVLAKDDQSPNPLGHLTTNCVFRLKDFDRFLDKVKNEFTLPDDLGKSIIDLSLSTTRGIMFNYFRGTFLHKAVLPIISFQSLIREN